MESFSPVPGTPLDFFASNPAVTWPLGQINGFYRFSTATSQQQPAAASSSLNLRVVVLCVRGGETFIVLFIKSLSQPPTHRDF